MVHHARKRAGNERPGQSLRGSSELHAWGDSNLYLRRVPKVEDCVELTIEHRAAPSANGIHLRLDLENNTPSLVLESGEVQKDQAKTPPEERIVTVLLSHGSSMGGDELKSSCKMRSSNFWGTLNSLIASQKIERLDTGGYQLI